MAVWDTRTHPGADISVKEVGIDTINLINNDYVDFARENILRCN